MFSVAPFWIHVGVAAYALRVDFVMLARIKEKKNRGSNYMK